MLKIREQLQISFVLLRIVRESAIYVGFLLKLKLILQLHAGQYQELP